MSATRRKRRQRAAAEGVSVPAGAGPGPRRADDRPPAPWGSFPLVEIAVLVALVMMVAGFLVQGERGGVLLATGLVLGSLAGLELSIREHLAGYRSHTVLLAAAGGIAVLLALTYFAGLAPVLALAVGAAVFAALALLLARSFKARTGRAFKLR